MSLNAHTELQEPAFSVGVEERVRQIVPIILWDFKWLIFDAVIKILQKRGEGQLFIRQGNSGGRTSFVFGGCDGAVIETDHYTQANPHPEKLLWQVSSFIDASVHGDKALYGGLVSDVGVM